MRNLLLAVSLFLTSTFALADLQAALDAQPDEVKARYDARHPGETLEFFGIEPGMTVVEALPGGGWYSKILLPYLGSDGQLVGADYALDLYRQFSFMTPERLKEKESWIADWTAQADGWRSDGDAGVSAFVLGSMPADMNGTADAVVFIRAFHNLARFDAKGGFFGQAATDAFDILKPGGVLGVVQHEARSDMPDDWADGSRGYLKKADLIARLEAAGFKYEAESDINANLKDQPTTDDIVWRLPPSLSTSRDDPELAATLKAVGESNRMTLRFRKPE